MLGGRHHLARPATHAYPVSSWRTTAADVDRSVAAIVAAAKNT